MRSTLLLTLLIFLLTAGKCNEKTDNTQKKKGRLEVAGICMNYTIALLEGNTKAGEVEAEWTDESTNKKYTNVFRLGNPCAFPSTIKQGDEFWFRIDTSKQEQCPVCMAYYPTPTKALSIKVIE